MAAKKNNLPVLPLNTVVEVISKSNDGRIFQKEMTIDEFNKLPKKEGWKYQAYQLGYSAYKEAIKIK